MQLCSRAVMTIVQDWDVVQDLITLRVPALPL